MQHECFVLTCTSVHLCLFVMCRKGSWLSARSEYLSPAPFFSDPLISSPLSVSHSSPSNLYHANPSLPLMPLLSRGRSWAVSPLHSTKATLTLQYSVCALVMSACGPSDLPALTFVLINTPMSQRETGYANVHVCPLIHTTHIIPCISHISH